MNRVPKIQVIKKNRTTNVDAIRKKRKVRILKQNNKIQINREMPAVIKPKKHKKNSNRIRELRQNKTVLRLQNKIVKNANYYKLDKLKDIGKDKFLIMVACGPSVLEIDLEPLKNLRNVDMMTINKPLKSIWPTKYWAFCDHSQYLRNKQTFDHYNGTLFNSTAVRARRDNQIIINVKHGSGVTRNIHEGYIIGRSSVYANLQLAIWMNYDKIFVFGVDMCAVNGKLHHYGVNPDVAENKRKERFKAEAQHYNRMGEVLPAHIKTKIYFCSSYLKWPFTQNFSSLDHKKAVNFILNNLNK